MPGFVTIRTSDSLEIRRSKAALRPRNAGVLSTAGGLVFVGEHKGLFTAVDARSGKPLWHFNTGALITSAPVTYSIDGRQFVAMVSGATVLSFALPDSAAK